MSAHATISEQKVAPVPLRRDGLYLFLLALQTIGAAMVLFNGVPIYRQIAGDFANHRPDPEILWWALFAVALIQTGYWIRLRLNLSPPPGENLLLAHIIAFASRLNFVFASSTFSVIFLVRFHDLSLTPQRIFMLLLVLFSLYCYTLELERLGKALQENGVKP